MSFHPKKKLILFLHGDAEEQAIGNEFPRDFVGISLAEQPGKYFLVIRGQRLVVETESNIQMIMEKLQSYKTRVALNFEVTGFGICLFFWFKLFCLLLELKIEE